MGTRKTKRGGGGGGDRKKRALLVVPSFPIPAKQRIRHNFVPIGLLKIGTYLRDAKGWDVELVFGEQRPHRRPDEIWITSLFTYWSEHVHRSAEYYHGLFPDARMRVGGIYASLMPEHTRKCTKSIVHMGTYHPAEKWCRFHGIDYTLLEEPVEFQILHGMRGCFRKCRFCGTWRIEPKEEFDSDIVERVRSNHVVFYDNNFLRNPGMKDTLKKLAMLKYDEKHVTYECQSGFDGRILDEEIAILLKKARFINPRIAWDNSLKEEKMIHGQIEMLKKAGYPAKDIYTFILYNWEHDFHTCEEKRLRCWQWGVQISDCRFRPLNSLYNHYHPRHAQTSRDYFIHPSWTDEEVKLFRANVRKHNICVRHGFGFHSQTLEHMRIPKRQLVEFNNMPKSKLKSVLPDVWFPEEFHGPDRSQSRVESFDTANIPCPEEKRASTFV